MRENVIMQLGGAEQVSTWPGTTNDSCKRFAFYFLQVCSLITMHLFLLTLFSILSVSKSKVRTG